VEVSPPLIAAPGAPIPAGGEAEWFAGSRGVRLRAALFPARGVARGSVVLSGGRTEPIEKYFEVIGELQARGLAVLVHDWRGQGLSHRELQDRSKGHATGYETFLGDYRALLDAFEARLPKPWIAVGHSMGGCLTLLALARGASQRFAGAVLSAPMLGLHLPGPAWIVGLLSKLFNALGLGERLTPTGGRQPEGFEGNRLTHDPVRFQRHKDQISAHPDLALGPPTWAWLDFALKAQAFLAKPANLKPVRLPVTICSAGRDQIVVNDAQEVAARALPQGRLVRIDGAFHEILMETDDKRAIFWSAFDAVADEVAPFRTAPVRLDQSAPPRKSRARKLTPPKG